MKKVFFVFFVFFVSEAFAQQKAEWNTPGIGNPIIPGYFADPTIRKFGDTFYVYATTDGTGNGYGPAQVWMTKDFVNWRNQVMNWPTTEVVWAPEVIEVAGSGEQGAGKTYRYYYCEPCMVHAGESDSPVGPWKNMLGEDDAVLMPDRYCHPRAITLDPQVFTDDDGSQYMFVGTWGFYDDSGCGWAKLAEDGKSFTDKGLISSRELKDFFEGPFLFKRNGIYYFTYSAGSCHDETYRVQYATSTEGPLGPYTYKGCILKTNEDGTVHGPGHHSILQDGDDFYIFYHRHNNPHSIHGFNRNLCLDRIEFDENGDILPVVPTHEGVLPESVKGSKVQEFKSSNLAFQAKVTASSYYDEWFKPEYAVDDNNGTLWRSRNNTWSAWIEIDLGEEKEFNQVWTMFEYPTFFYQYMIETSSNGMDWQMYADKRGNTDAGSPMIDKKEAKARYLRITVTDTQKFGHFAGIWNVKVYNATAENDPEKMLPSVEGMDMKAVEAGYPNLHRKDVEAPYMAYDYIESGEPLLEVVAAKEGTLEKTNYREVLPADVEIIQGKYAYCFDGTEKYTITRPKEYYATLTYNAPYTICAWIMNPEVGPVETVMQVGSAHNDLATVEFRQGTDRSNGLIAHNASFENFGAAQECQEGAGRWQFWTVTYDGWMEKVYLNGKLVKEKNSFLMQRQDGTVTIGGGAHGDNKFSGFLHSISLYDYAFTPEQIDSVYQLPTDTDDKPSYNFDGVKIEAQVITPKQVDIRLVDSEGNEFRKGVQTFSNDIKNGTVRSTITVSDYEGNELKTFTKKTKIDSRMFKTYTLGDIADGQESVRLESAGKDMNTNSEENGPMKMMEVEGDFVVECHVSEMMGQQRHRTPAYNEGGIMILTEGRRGQEIVHLGVFPNYNCGNMLTQVRGGMRPQFPNQKGWDYDPYMQLQRTGDKIYARTSSDGVHWEEMPGSPIEVPHWQGKTLKAGIYQTTYTEASAWVEFDSWQLTTSAQNQR